jgi:hypothetical protein
MNPLAERPMVPNWDFRVGAGEEMGIVLADLIKRLEVHGLQARQIAQIGKIARDQDGASHLHRKNNLAICTI